MYQNPEHITKPQEVHSSKEIDQQVDSALKSEFEDDVDGILECTEELLEKGAAPLIPDDERQIAIHYANRIRAAMTDFAPLLLIARTVFHRFPALVAADDFPIQFLEALKDWNTNGDQGLVFPDDYLRFAAYLMPADQFLSYMRLCAENARLDEKVCRARMAA